MPLPLLSYDFATYVIDARNGKFLYGQNYQKRLNPASLTKMMTIYLTFHGLKNQAFSLDSLVTVSRNSSQEPPSKMGLKQGQKVSVKNLLRSAAIRSANDSATALGEFISGSEANFADYMTRTARLMGMRQTVFKNANGLTAKGHLSTAEDMGILARRLILDFPEYYNLFSRLSENVLGRKIYNTNRRFLGAYKGADGIKTGFTSAAGYNLAGSAKRGKNRIIGIVIGGGSVPLRNKRMSELLDIGFSKLVGTSTIIPLASLKLSRQVKNVNLGSIDFSFPPMARPKILIADSIVLLIEQSLEATGFVETSSGEKETAKLPHTEMLKSGDERKGLYGNDTTGFWRTPLARPASSEKNNLAASKKILENSQLVVSGEIKAQELSQEIKRESLEQESEAIYVGFYFTRYNAEKDLARIILNDVKIIKPKSKDIISSVYRNKTGFKVKFYPFTPSGAEKSCLKLRAEGFLCHVEPE